MHDKAKNKERGRDLGKRREFFGPMLVTLCEGLGDHDIWDQLVSPHMSAHIMCDVCHWSPASRVWGAGRPTFPAATASFFVSLARSLSFYFAQIVSTITAVNLS